MVRKLIAVVALMVLPAVALADASVIQEYCEQLNEGSDEYVIVHITLVNFSLSSAVCDLHLVPEPQPVLPGCEIVQCTAPDGWQCSLNPQGGVDFFASTPGDCVSVGSFLDGFEIVLHWPELCCYVAQFTGPAGEIILEQEECFRCTVIDVETTTWGAIKNIYGR